MKGNVINLNTLHLNSVRLNGIGKVQSVSLKGGSTEDPVFPPVEPPIEPEPTPTYTLSASVTNGKVSATKNGQAVSLPYTANEGDTIVLSVTPNDGYAFEGWNDGNTDNPRSITMTADVALSAQCVEVVQPPVGNYIQFEDKAVEAICVANWSSDGIGLTEEDAAKVTSIGQWFRENKSIKSFDEFKYFTGVKSLDGDAFAEATNLETISLPPHCTIIGSAAFGRCSKLATINGLEQVTSVGSQGFLIAKITSLSLPNYQGAIAERAFSYCSNLELADLGAGVTQLSGEVFSSDTKLATLIVRATTPPSLVGTNFYQCPLSVIYVPDASLEAYKGAINWVSFADRIHPLSEIEGSLVFYDKLVGDGTAYINTEYYPTSWDNVEWDADAPSVYNKYIFGCKSSVLSVANLVYSATQSYYNYKPSTSATTINEDNAKRQRRTMRIVDLGNGSYRREVADLDSGVVNSIDAGWSGKDVVATNALRVFCSTTSAGANEKFYKGAIRSLVITDAKTGNTIMSLKPCTFAGEAGMWDEVNGKFYGNAAIGGEFSVAND